jgi:hypothetical protein
LNLCPSPKSPEEEELWGIEVGLEPDTVTDDKNQYLHWQLKHPESNTDGQRQQHKESWGFRLAMPTGGRMSCDVAVIPHGLCEKGVSRAFVGVVLELTCG